MITHHYSLQFLREDRTPVGDAAGLKLGGVLSGGVEALHWQLFRQGKNGIEDEVRVVPSWSQDFGEPVVQAIQLEASPAAVSLPVGRLFRAAALRQRLHLIESGVLAKEDRPVYVVMATPAEEASPLPVFHLDDYPLCDEQAESEGALIDADFAAEDEFPVIIAREVIADAIRCAEAAGEAETGGVLFGRLMKTSAGGRAALSVTHLCPAVGGHGDGTSFTFTPDTWTAAETALAERGRNEIMVGSSHSHPDFCRDCPPERQESCKMREPFFSSDDEQLHQSVFPAAYSVGLLVSHDATGFIPSLWGWRDGFITRRSYFLKS